MTTEDRVVLVELVEKNALLEQEIEKLLEYIRQKRQVQPDWEYGEDTEEEPILVPMTANIVVDGNQTGMDCLLTLAFGPEPEEANVVCHFDFPEEYNPHSEVWKQQCLEQLQTMMLAKAGDALGVSLLDKVVDPLT